MNVTGRPRAHGTGAVTAPWGRTGHQGELRWHPKSCRRPPPFVGALPAQWWGEAGSHSCLRGTGVVCPHVLHLLHTAQAGRREAFRVEPAGSEPTSEQHEERPAGSGGDGRPGPVDAERQPWKWQVRGRTQEHRDTRFLGRELCDHSHGGLDGRVREHRGHGPASPQGSREQCVTHRYAVTHPRLAVNPDVHAREPREAKEPWREWSDPSEAAGDAGGQTGEGASNGVGNQVEAQLGAGGPNALRGRTRGCPGGSS